MRRRVAVVQGRASSGTAGSGTDTNSGSLVEARPWIVKVWPMWFGSTAFSVVPSRVIVPSTVPWTDAKNGLLSSSPLSYCLIVTVTRLCAGTLRFVDGP